MDFDSDPPDSGQLSLKARYLLAASVIAAFLISGAVLASWYAGHVTLNNTEALALRHEVTALTNDIRNDIWSADIALNAMLIKPRAQYEGLVTANLDRAKSQLESLAVHSAIESANLLRQIQILRDRIATLADKTGELIVRRQDPNWVYPVLPYISEKLLEPNIEFESSADVALQEIAEADGRSYASELYGRFDQVRDLWRRMILNFRAVLVRFAGLNDLEQVPQELNVESLHSVIEEQMSELDAMKERGELGLESEFSLERMREASARWYENWKTVKAYRSSSIWRADLHELETTIRPAQHAVFGALTALEGGIMAWSESNVAKVQAAASQMSKALWALSALALGFTALMYLLINRSVLTPITRIANAISSEGEFVPSELHSSGSKEINHLVEAFNSMRRQIHQRQMALEHQALHDSLTGLPNRALMQDRLEQAIHIIRRNNDQMAFLLLDLNRFKEINDALGHQVGDQLLQQVGQRLQKILRESDSVARLGGDEFAIVAPNTEALQAERFALKIAKAINEVFTVGMQNLYVGASIGIALYPEHGTDAGTLVRHADIAMYVAKRNNLGYSLYDETMDEHRVDNLALLGDLHEELKNPSGLELHYQPQINLFTREVVAIEALLRWKHPQMGFVSPEQVIAMAEHAGQIAALTKWVIETAIRECMEFRVLHNGVNIAINLSAWNLQDPDLPRTIAQTLDLYRLPAERLTLEITEGAMMNDPVRARQVLDELSKMGIELAIDDFGTGFSSLGYLKMLPVNSLKIDKSFVIEMLRQENDAVIVQSTVDLAHNLGLTVIAEGVESHETMLRLRKLKCDIAQGFHICKPMPKNSLEKWLETYHPKLAQ